MELPSARVLRGNKAFWGREERIAFLETENATLHIQLAQMQNSFRSLLERKLRRQRCARCDAIGNKTSILHQQIQQLRGSFDNLQHQYRAYEHQAQGHFKTLSTLPPVITQMISCKSSDFTALCGKYQQERKRRKELHNILIELRGNIRVHCIVRPVLQQDFDKGTEECMKCIDDETVQVNHIQSSFSGSCVTEKLFTFDRVHGPVDSQQVIFSEVRPLVTSLLDGYNVCIMAYGQTGGGKTHTMLGRADTSKTVGNNQTSGIIPQAAVELFRLIRQGDDTYEVSVTVTEIYNEQIRDLLSPQQVGGIHRSSVISPVQSGSDVGMKNLTIRSVSNPIELISLVRDGMKHRATHSTDIHEHSSRSHLIVTIHITRTREEGDLTSTASSESSLQLNTTITPVDSQQTTPRPSPASSPPHLTYNTLSRSSSFGTSSNRNTPRSQPLSVKLQLVDLAGSECVGQSGVDGSNLREAKFINRSLCSLSDVLYALAENRTHVPYRNSILTHLLQDSIGGSAKMLMFLCLSPTSQYLGESLRVLGFGTRARQVQRSMSVKKIAT